MGAIGEGRDVPPAGSGEPAHDDAFDWPEAGPAKTSVAETPNRKRKRPTPISPTLHGALDYMTWATLIALPRALRLKGTPARAFVGAGASHVAYSLVTDYRLGVLKRVPMRAHLALDAAGAVALAVSPWALGGARRGPRHWLPQVVAGAYELGAVVMTDPDG